MTNELLGDLPYGEPFPKHSDSQEVSDAAHWVEAQVRSPVAEQALSHVNSQSLDWFYHDFRGSIFPPLHWRPIAV